MIVLEPQVGVGDDALLATLRDPKAAPEALLSKKKTEAEDRRFPEPFRRDAGEGEKPGHPGTSPPRPSPEEERIGIVEVPEPPGTILHRHVGNPEFEDSRPAPIGLPEKRRYP
jgi:hypothetical protein